MCLNFVKLAEISWKKIKNLGFRTIFSEVSVCLSGLDKVRMSGTEVSPVTLTMEAKKAFVVGRESDIGSEIGSRSLDIEGAINIEERQCSENDLMEMDIETADAEKSSLSDEDEYGTDIVDFSSEKSGGGSHKNVVFSREPPLVMKEDFSTSACTFSAEKLKSRLIASEYEHGKNVRKLSHVDRIELGRLFQGAVSARDWELAESLIFLADFQTLNDALCISLDSIWFLSTHLEVDGITGLIRKIIANGAYDFTRAVLRTSFLASCVSSCQSRTMSMEDTVNLMSQRLHERLQECSGDEVLKAEAGAKVRKFTEWALKCISFHARCQGNRDMVGNLSVVGIQLQLSAFKTFLDITGNYLTGKDFTEAFDAACFPLTLFSSSFDPGWSSGLSATAIQGLLGMLVEGGADNVNQCFLEASRFGSTELVRILLQIAQRNSLDVDVDLALGFASHYGKISTMECLVEDGNAMAFLGPLMRAAERGCIPVVKWFVQRGCRDMELCLALTAATSSSQVEAATYLLPHVPQHILAALSIEILKAAGERSGGSLDGVAFLLHSDFLRDPAATYAVADTIARSEDETVTPELRDFLQEHWSEAAFLDGLRQGEVHFSNLVQILKWGKSPICLSDLPGPLRVVIAYLPLYRECVKAGGNLLSQKHRGQLVEAARILGGVVLDEPGQRTELLAILEHHLPPFLLHPAASRVAP